MSEEYNPFDTPSALTNTAALADARVDKPISVEAARGKDAQPAGSRPVNSSGPSLGAERNEGTLSHFAAESAYAFNGPTTLSGDPLPPQVGYQQPHAQPQVPASFQPAPLNGEGGMMYTGLPTPFIPAPPPPYPGPEAFRSIPVGYGPSARPAYGEPAPSTISPTSANLYNRPSPAPQPAWTAPGISYSASRGTAGGASRQSDVPTARPADPALMAGLNQPPSDYNVNAPKKRGLLASLLRRKGA